MYVRPFVVGSGGVIGLEPAKGLESVSVLEYLFCVVVCPVGDYYKVSFSFISN